MKLPILTATVLVPSLLAAGEAALITNVRRLCQAYLEGFGHANTEVCYHHRLNTPRGIGVLSSPAEIATRVVRGKPMPYGYGSGIQDVPLENGQFLFALCDAYEATRGEYFAETARGIFSGLKLVATVSPEPGFVPRGPHPDGKSYYPDSSRDQHCAFVEALWRYFVSPLATGADKAFIADALGKVARRMERNDWVIKVEDGSHMAHVGWGWKQHTTIGAATLLSVLAAARETTGDEHWAQLYERFSQEKDGIRWRLLSAEHCQWRPFTLYSNQFMTSLALLARTESEANRVRQLKTFVKAMAERALHTKVFDESHWRRLDWAGKRSDQETTQALAPFGLSLAQEATVFDVCRKFDPELMNTRDWRRKRVNGKLLFGIPTVAFHKALLSEDPALVREVAPYVRRMVEQMLTHGHLYSHGENFNRAVLLGLHLVALQAKPQGR